MDSGSILNTGPKEFADRSKLESIYEWLQSVPDFSAWNDEATTIYQKWEKMQKEEVWGRVNNFQYIYLNVLKWVNW